LTLNFGNIPTKTKIMKDFGFMKDKEGERM